MGGRIKVRWLSAVLDLSPSAFFFFKPIFGGKGCDHILFTPPNNLLLLIPGKLYELVSIFRYVSPG